MNDLISIIVPVYNVAGYVEKCIKSIVGQTYRNLQIILVDDGSTDGSCRICDDWAVQDDRIIVIHEENAGISMARNIGMRIASGKYLMFVDSDDYLHSEAVQLLYTRILMDGSDLAIGNGVCVNEEGEIIGNLYTTVHDARCTQKMIYTFFYSIPCMVWGKLYRRSVLENLRFPTLSSGEDLWMLYDIVSNCKTVSLCSECIYYYTQRMTSIVHTLNDSKCYDSAHAAVYVCRELMKNGYWMSAKKFYAAALFRAADMDDPKPARKLIANTFPWYNRIRLIKFDCHHIIRWMALNVPIIHRILKKRHS